jgi:Family of unknown function (DUF5321)
MAVFGAVGVQMLRSKVTESFTHFRSDTSHCLRSRCVSTDSHVLPKIAQPSIWHSIVPRALRNKSKKPSELSSRKAPNSASYFIWIYLLIGSQAVRILQLQNDFNTFTRRADLKIEKLRKVVEALQRGEEVDVEKALGTGNEVQEREWEEALREIENEDRIWQTNKQKRREAKAKAKENAAHKATADTASPVNDSVDQDAEGQSQQDSRPREPGFY